MSRRGLVFGVGINDLNYPVQKCEVISSKGMKMKRRVVWECPYYRCWYSMLRRSCCSKFKSINKAYKDVEVCCEWLLFSNFKKWMSGQDWVGKALDKDMLSGGGLKVYSPDTCLFLESRVNNFIRETTGRGTTWKRKNKKYCAQVNNPITGKREHIGLYATEMEARRAYVKRKHEIACTLASSQSDARVEEYLKNMYKTEYESFEFNKGVS